MQHHITEVGSRSGLVLPSLPALLCICNIHTMFEYFRCEIFQTDQVLEEWTSLQKIVIYQKGARDSIVG